MALSSSRIRPFLSSFRPNTAMAAPASASAIAIARPMPPFPPVTMATRPVKSNSARVSHRLQREVARTGTAPDYRLASEQPSVSVPHLTEPSGSMNAVQPEERRWGGALFVTRGFAKLLTQIPVVLTPDACTRVNQDGDALR